MKLPAFFPPALRKKQKLRASAVARRSAVGPAELDEMAEPNMKLSRALLIVLVLHIVAVAGIIAFNAIKSRQGPTVAVAAAESAPALLPKKVTAEPEASAPPVKKVANTMTPGRLEKKKAIEDSGKTYVVAKGDTPVTIAKKFKIPTDDLLSANKIDDPHKLKIGQKLIIPVKTAKPKKGAG